MPTCMVIGQAAGVAVALANYQELQIDQVSIDELVTVLKSEGADLR